jgi:hypothetical protein
MPIIKCTYCDQPVAVETLYPPLCARHQDILVLINRAQRFDIEITPQSLTKLMELATGRNWSITPAEIPQLLQEVL